MKKAIIDATKVGMITGFVSALGYSIIALIITELFLPFPDPRQASIFGKDFLYLLSTYIIPTSPFWLFGPTIIGAITAIGFSVYLVKARPSKQKFIRFCTVACIVITSPLLLITIAAPIYAIFFNGVFHPFIDPVTDMLLEVGFPAITYILAGYISSNYLYNNNVKRSITG